MRLYSRTGTNFLAQNYVYIAAEQPAPDIAVQEPAGTDLADGIASIDFGNVNVGSSSAGVTFTILDSGTASLTALAVSTDGANSGDFAVGTLGATTLAPNASTTFSVTFTPGGAGARSAAIHVASNVSGTKNPFDISLSGSGVTTGLTLAQALDTSGLTWITGGDANWSGQTKEVKSTDLLRRSGLNGFPDWRIWALCSLLVPAPITSAGTIPDLPLEQSAFIVKGQDGSLSVGQSNGAPIDGFKLSQYDCLVLSPNVAVASDGTIHIAFIEQQQAAPFAQFVYQRQSSDGGKSWSDAKNLSEDMPNFHVGHCKLLIDSNDRVYVIWRTGLKENWAALQTPGGRAQNNLVYRVLDQGKWSKILRVHPPGSVEIQGDGSISYTAVVDGAGRAQVIWNSMPSRFHPEQTMRIVGQLKQGLPYIGAGLIFQATLDGSDPGKPREFYMAPVTVDPRNPDFGKSCDDYNSIEGYVDAGGAPHLLARVLHPPHFSGANTQLELIEGGKETPAIELPGVYTQLDANPPKLLLDAKGRKHVIAFYNAGEHPNFRDYLLGSDDEPTVIFAAKGPRGRCCGFQAYQGPSGKMAVVMQATDEGL